MHDPLPIAQALIRCRSVTPADDGALAYVAGLLEEAGFRVERPVFSEPGMPDIENLYAVLGEGGPCLVLAGHTDVVPPGDEASWTSPPFAADVKDGLLYGRGAVDMKGGVAAMLAAALDFAEARPVRGSLAFLLTGDEEGPAVNGTVKVLDWAKARGERMDHCLLGEPTCPERLGDMMKIGRRGSLSGTLVVRGKQGHVAYPNLVENPIPPLARIVTALADTPLDRGNAHFGPSTLQFTTVDVGNPASNVVPAEARARFNIRFNDLWTPETLAAEIRGRVEAAAGQAQADLTFAPTNAVAFLTAPGPFVSLVAGAITAETGLTPELSTSGGTSDARFIKDVCPVVEFGPVGRTMHAVDENVPVEELRSLARIYGRVIRDYFNTQS